MKTDPVTLELFKNALFSIADEMAVTICRTTYSGVLRDNMDFSTAFTDADGKLVAQGLTIPLHLGSIPTALEAVLAEFEGDIHPGDVFVINDPYHGGMHLPDVFIFKPILLMVSGWRLVQPFHIRRMWVDACRDPMRRIRLRFFRRGFVFLRSSCTSAASRMRRCGR